MTELLDRLEVDDYFDDLKRRVWGARYDLMKLRVPVDEFAIYVAPDIWRHLERIVGASMVMAEFWGLPLRLDRTLDDNQIRLRCEVIA